MREGTKSRERERGNEKKSRRERGREGGNEKRRENVSLMIHM